MNIQTPVPAVQNRRQPALLAALAAACLGAVGPASAAAIWAPMWDIRNLPMTFEAKASGSSMTFGNYFADCGSLTVRDAASATVATLSGCGQLSTTFATTAGQNYRFTYTSGFHVRPNWDGAEWVRLGAGAQGAGPGGAIGFQSDAELGFDDRWQGLSSKFADTTWYYYVGANEQLKISVEEITGDATGAAKFEWIAPSGTVTTADADGIPGSLGNHFPARGGSLSNAPDPASQFWEEYTAPVNGEAGWWGFKLSARDYSVIHLNPYAWHYILDRTDDGADQNHYLLTGSIADPNRPLPEPGSLALAGLGLAAAAGLRRRRR